MTVELQDRDHLAELFGVESFAIDEAFRPKILGKYVTALSSPNSPHGDVFELERISYLARDGIAESLVPLPDIDPELAARHPLMQKIVHVSGCVSCRFGVQEFADLRPTDNEIRLAFEAS